MYITKLYKKYIKRNRNNKKYYRITRIKPLNNNRISYTNYRIIISMIYNNINILLSKTYKFKQNKFHRNKQYKLFKTNKIYFI